MLDTLEGAVEKLLIAERDVEAFSSVRHEGPRAHLVDVIQPHMLQDIVEQFERGVSGEPQQTVVEAGVVIAPLDAEMDLGPPQSVFELAVVRPLLERFFISLDCLEPVMRPLLLNSRIDR